MRGLAVHTETIVGHLDVRDALSDPLGRGEARAGLPHRGSLARAGPVGARDGLLDYLRDISLPGQPGVLPHPVDVMIARKPVNQPAARELFEPGLQLGDAVRVAR